MSNQSQAQGYEGIILRLIVVLIVVGTGLVALNSMVTAFTNFGPPPVGVMNGNLTPCLMANCLSSQEMLDSDQYIAPLDLSVSSQDAMQILEQVVRRLPNSNVRLQDESYLFVRIGSAWNNGAVDVEIYINEVDNRIELKFEPRASGTDIEWVRERSEQLRRLYILELS